MKKKAAITAMALAFSFTVSAARAQFGMPIGAGPFSITAPEAGAGLVGAGAAKPYNPPQTCTPEYRGRGGVSTQCAPDAASPAKGKP